MSSIDQSGLKQKLLLS